MESAIVEADLKNFFHRLGHLRHGCSEWVLIDPRSREVRGVGFFDDIDLLLSALETYAPNFSIQVCRNPRPIQMMDHNAGRNQFNRALSKPSLLETLEILHTTVFLFRTRNRGSAEDVGRFAAGLVSRLGISEYSTEAAGSLVSIRVHFEPSAPRRFGGSDVVRTVFARLEEHLRDSMTPEEKSEIELVPWSGPDMFDPAVGLAHPSVAGTSIGRWLYEPSDKPDAVLDQLLADLQAGKTLKPSSSVQTYAISRTEGLMTEWDDGKSYEAESFKEGTGILPKGAKIQIESEAGKQAKGQLENLEALAREAYMSRATNIWHAPTPSKTLNAKAGGGSRAGEIWLMEGASYKAVQDWLCSGIEGILRQQDALVFWTSTRLLPGAFLARSVERSTGRPLEELGSQEDSTAASQAVQQFRAQLKRMPVLFPHAGTDSAHQILQQMQQFRHSDEALQTLPGLVVLDGFDDFAHDPSALRSVRRMAQEVNSSVWLGCVGDSKIPVGAVDVKLSLVLGEGALREWIDSLHEGEPDRHMTEQVLPRLYPEIQHGRLPAVIRAENVHQGWVMHAYHLYYPATGRFQNIVPKQGA